MISVVVVLENLELTKIQPIFPWDIALDMNIVHLTNDIINNKRFPINLVQFKESYAGFVLI